MFVLCAENDGFVDFLNIVGFIVAVAGCGAIFVSEMNDHLALMHILKNCVCSLVKNLLTSFSFLNLQKNYLAILNQVQHCFFLYS